MTKYNMALPFPQSDKGLVRFKWHLIHVLRKKEGGEKRAKERERERERRERERERERKERERERDRQGNTAVQTHNHMTVSIHYTHVPGVDLFTLVI